MNQFILYDLQIKGYFLLLWELFAIFLGAKKKAIFRGFFYLCHSSIVFDEPESLDCLMRK
ncbi:hypothetical protein Hanom_Chr01g00016041 [Helianthus anomalus]